MQSKKLLISAGALILSSSSYAKTLDVTVQCATEGPLYKGTIMISDFLGCGTGSPSYSNDFHMDFEEPATGRFLNFNNVSYQLRYTNLVTNSSCKHFYSTDSTAVEIHSGLTKNIQIQGDQSKVSGTIGEDCSFKVN